MVFSWFDYRAMQILYIFISGYHVTCFGLFQKTLQQSSDVHRETERVRDLVTRQQETANQEARYTGRGSQETANQEARYTGRGSQETTNQEARYTGLGKDQLSPGNRDIIKFVHESSGTESEGGGTCDRGAQRGIGSDGGARRCIESDGSGEDKKGPRKSPEVAEKSDEHVPLRRRLGQLGRVVTQTRGRGGDESTQRTSPRRRKNDLSPEIEEVEGGDAGKSKRGRSQARRGRGRGRRIQRDDGDGSDDSGTANRRGRNKSTTLRGNQRTGKRGETPQKEDRNITEFFTKNNDDEVVTNELVTKEMVTKEVVVRRQKSDHNQGDSEDDRDTDHYDDDEPTTAIFPTTQDRIRFENSSMMSTPGEPPETFQINADVHSTPKSITKSLTSSASKWLGSIKSYFTGINLC